MSNILAAATLIASQMGAPLPADAPVVAPAAISKEVPGVRAAAASGYVFASGTLSGSGSLYCSPTSNDSGWLNGLVYLTAEMPVNAPDGVHGKVLVSGYVFLSGPCRKGAGFVSGSALIAGGAPLYSREGRRAGMVQLRGYVSVNQYATPFVSINQHATLNGYFTADPAN